MVEIITWNMQGGRGDNVSKWTQLTQVISNPKGLGLSETPEVIFLQECSIPTNWKVPPEWNREGEVVQNGYRNFGTLFRPLY